MGVIYWYQGFYNKAIEYFNKNIQLSTELGDTEGLAASFGNMAIIFDDLGQLDSSLVYYNKALKIYIDENNEIQLASCYDNMSLIYLQKGDFNKALEIHKKGYELRLKNKDEKGIMASLENLGNIYIKQKRPDKAIEVSLEVLHQASQINAREDIKYALMNLKDAYVQKGDFKTAFSYQERLSLIKDSIRSQENNNAIAELEARFKNKENESELNEIKLAQELKEKENESNNRKKNFLIIILFISIASVFAITYLFFKRYKEKQKVAEQLEIKNNAINEQKQIIDKAYIELAEKNKDITDSIIYAKRIQEAIFPPKDYVSKYLPNSFVLFKPKDIVSGDFYWMEVVNDAVYFAVVDCTGHGVPGAFMSIVGFNLLNKAIHENKCDSPAEILNQINVDLNETLRQSIEESKVKDGMEISLCKWDKKSNELTFAGANHILYQISDNQLKIHKGDKHPIGGFYGEELHTFNNVKVSIKTGDCIYLTSDGYADQFGGPKGKKFKYKQLEEKFVSLHTNEMEMQKQELNRIFNEWRGNLEQLDDVLIFGLKI